LNPHRVEKDFLLVILYVWITAIKLYEETGSEYIQTRRVVKTIHGCDQAAIENSGKIISI